MNLCANEHRYEKHIRGNVPLAAAQLRCHVAEQNHDKDNDQELQRHSAAGSIQLRLCEEGVNQETGHYCCANGDAIVEQCPGLYSSPAV